MDKYEYKVRADEIKALIADGEYAEAVKIADTIDWRRVRSVMMLCTVSDLYKVNRRYQESKDLLLLAYEKHPTGRLIVYSLCELSIKMEEYVQAVEYYKEFVQIAPKDTGQYVLLYRLYEAQEVSLEERIAVLEDLKKRDYREKWAYELAYLYHRIGLTTKCIEECDEMYLWFGEGKYVIKALELKALHVPLNAEQQANYNKWLAYREEEIEGDQAKETSKEADEEIGSQTEDMWDGESQTDEETEDDPAVTAAPTTELPEVKTVDVGQYNTLNLQRALAESMKEILTDEEAAETGMQPEPQEPEKDQISQNIETQPEPEDAEEEPPSIAEKIIAPLLQETQELPKVETVSSTSKSQDIDRQSQPIAEQKPEIKANNKPVKYDNVLSQEYDGQIRLLVPETEEKAVEKQITGQLSIEDIMTEWEEMKKSNEQKRMEDVRKRILNQTGSLFASFDEATKSGLLEQMEKAFKAAMLQDEDEEAAIKKVIIPEDAIAELKAAAQAEAKPKMKDTVSEADSIPEPMPEKATESKEKAKEIESAGPQDIAKKDTVTDRKSQSQQTGARAVRALTDEEQELFGQYIHHRKSREQLIHTLDNMSMAACTGNVIITGEEGGGTLSLAKDLIREMQYNDSNFSGKIAKISAGSLNKKDVAETLKRLSNGALIIERAADLNTETVVKLGKTLETDNMGLLLFLEDTKSRMNQLLEENASLYNNFNLRVDIKPLNDEALVACAKQYAEKKEYSIDEFGILALHTRIADMQSIDHEVSRAEVIDLVDEAIYYANKKTPKHFVDILLAKRYDEEDMIILRENDFMHY